MYCGSVSHFGVKYNLVPKKRISITGRYSTASKPVLITTPIFYVNSYPHVGHLFSGLIGDAISRWYKIKGNQTLFATGTDEHGLKVQQAAEKHNLSPGEYCTKISSEFRRLFDKSNIKYDVFIR